MTTNKPTSRNA